MAFAWRIMFISNRFVMQPLTYLNTEGAKNHELFETSSFIDSNRIILLNRLIEAEVHHKGIANKQVITVVAMAAGFGLLSVGFALFVMGIESAFQVSGSAGEVGEVVLKASSPGLMCFLLAGTIIVLATSQEHKVHFGKFTVYPNSNIVNETQKTSDGMTDLDKAEEILKKRGL